MDSGKKIKHVQKCAGHDLDKVLHFVIDQRKSYVLRQYYLMFICLNNNFQFKSWLSTSCRIDVAASQKY